MRDVEQIKCKRWKIHVNCKALRRRNETNKKRDSAKSIPLKRQKSTDGEGGDEEMEMISKAHESERKIWKYKLVYATWEKTFPFFG